jgi:hypothetical protein
MEGPQVTDETKEQELRDKVRNLEERVDALITAVRSVKKQVGIIETTRNKDMSEIKALLNATADARVLQEVKRATMILDGDPSVGLVGMRTTVEENASLIRDLVKIKDRIFWVGLGMAMTSSGIGVLIGELIKKAIGP